MNGPQLPRHRALAILTQCTGDDIWSVQHCQQQGVPQSWIDELADAHESGFEHRDQTIFLGDRPTNQYHGVHDLQLAIRIAESFQIDVGRLTANVMGRRQIVQVIVDVIEEG